MPRLADADPSSRGDGVSRAAAEREQINSTEHHGREWVVRLLLLCLIQHLPAAFGTDLSVSPGATVTLPCDGPAVNDTNQVEVLWIYGSRAVCSFNNRTLCQHPDFVHRTQLQSIQQNNFGLVINDVRIQDAGGYKCLINGKVMQRIRLSVRGGRKRRDAETSSKENLVCKPYEDKDKEVPDENPPGAHSNVWLTVSLPVIMGIVVTVVIVGLLVWLIKRRNQPGTQMRTAHYSYRWVVRLLLLCLVPHRPAAFGTDLYVSPGATATLPCDGPAVNDTNQVENNFGLVINDVRIQDAGGYKCLINGAVMQRIRLSVRGGRKRRAAETPPEENLVCKPYEDKDKEVPDENPPGAHLNVWLTVSLSVIMGIMGIVVIVVTVWLIKRRNQPGTQMRTDRTATTEGDDTPQQSSSAGDDTPQQSSSAGDDTPQQSSSAGDDTPQQSSSAGDDTPQQSSSTGDNTPQQSSSAGDDTPQQSSSAGDDTPQQSSSTGDDTPQQSSSAGDDSRMSSSRSPVLH
ncbi:uncharacterized protein LOC125721669 [Brienomyrus brachyistius]|uniref:uncharacterized protein LOC125721669 n=1 Tax=Brienomyrus brachyistius TaxID=42636 RepID=UPI0020B21639|nr:uncharacterized protein LOC125721669 [Brienomyrus brachyistius]